MPRRWKRTILVGLGVPNVVAGVWAVVSPSGWYDDFPGTAPRVVSALPPFNEHLASDTGAGLLATGVVMLLAGAWLRRDAVLVATVGYLAFSVPHAVFHLRHPADAMTTVQNVGNAVVLWLGVALAGAVLVAEGLAGNRSRGSE